VRHGGDVLIAALAGRFAAGAVLEHGGAQQRDRRFKLADLDELALARALAGVQRRHQADGGVERVGGEVGVLVAERQRPVLGVAGDRLHPRAGRDHVPERPPARPRSAACHRRHVDDDDAGVDAPHDLVADPPALELVAAEVADDAVADRRQPAQERAPLGVAEVERAGALARVRVLEVAARLRVRVRVAGQDAVERRAVGARHVHPAGGLDLDHVGAEVGQQPRAERSGDDPGEVEQADARERRPHRYTTPSARSRSSAAASSPSSP
jgi:hypothetical protein